MTISFNNFINDLFHFFNDEEIQKKIAAFASEEQESSQESSLDPLSPTISSYQFIEKSTLSIETSQTSFISTTSKVTHIQFNHFEKSTTTFSTKTTATPSEPPLKGKEKAFESVLTSFQGLILKYKDLNRDEIAQLKKDLFTQNASTGLSPFELLMRKPHANTLFDQILNFVENTDLNQNVNWRSQIFNFAFSKCRYEAVFLQDKNIPKEIEEESDKTLKRCYSKDLGTSIDALKEKGSSETWLGRRMRGSKTLASDSTDKEKSREGWLAAEAYTRKLAEYHRKKKSRIEFSQIQKMHRLMTNGEEGVSSPGSTRDEKATKIKVVRAGGSWTNVFCPPEYLAEHLVDFEDFLNREIERCEKGEKNPIILASQAYQKFITLHPFENGNGRVARMIMDYILIRFGIVPPNMGEDVVDGLFPLSNRSKSSPEFIKKILSYVNKSYEEFLELNSSKI